MATQLPFIWLGSGRAKRRNIGGSALFLDKAAKAGLPVPNGGILLDDFWQLCLQEGIVQQQGTAVFCPDPDWLRETIYEGLRFPRLNGPVQLRRLASAGQTESPTFVGPVDSAAPAQLAQALCELWSVPPVADTPRHVLVQVPVPAVVSAGTAMITMGYTDDWVQLTTADAVTLLPQIWAGEAPDSRLPADQRRLQRLLRGIRRTFGDRNWRVTWQDDGATCWLLDLQSAPVPPPRQDRWEPLALPDWLPPPTPLRNQLLQAGGEQFVIYYRQFDRQLNAERPFITILDGQPHYNASWLVDRQRRWGIANTDHPTGWGRWLHGRWHLFRLKWQTRRPTDAPAADSLTQLTALLTRYLVLRFYPTAPSPAQQFPALGERCQQLTQQLLREAATAVAAGRLDKPEQIWQQTLTEARQALKP